MFQKGLFLWSYEFSKKYVNFSDEIFGQKNFFPKMGIDGPNVISIESSYRAEYKNIFLKIFWPFCTKLQKVEILGVGGLGAEGPQTAGRRPAVRGPKARA